MPGEIAMIQVHQRRRSHRSSSLIARNRRYWESAQWQRACLSTSMTMFLFAKLVQSVADDQYWFSSAMELMYLLSSEIVIWSPQNTLSKEVTYSSIDSISNSSDNPTSDHLRNTVRCDLQDSSNSHLLDISSCQGNGRKWETRTIVVPRSTVFLFLLVSPQKSTRYELIRVLLRMASVCWPHHAQFQSLYPAVAWLGIMQMDRICA